MENWLSIISRSHNLSEDFMKLINKTTQLSALSDLFVEGAVLLPKQFSVVYLQKLCLGIFSVEEIQADIFKTIIDKYRIEPENSQNTVLKKITKAYNVVLVESGMKLFARKLFFLQNGLPSRNCLLELFMTNKTNHKNLQTFQKVSICEFGIFLFYPYLPLAWNDVFPAQKDKFLYYANQLISAVKHLHEQGVAHRDIKKENIRFTVNGSLVLFDFDTASFNNFTDEPVDTWPVCTEATRAPELFQKHPYDAKKLDMWSVGIVVASMFQENYLFTSTKKYYENNDWPPPVANVIKCLLQKNPADRHWPVL